MTNRSRWKKTVAVTLRLIVLLVAGVCIAVAASCGSTEHRELESIGSTTAGLKSTTFASSQYIFGRTTCDTARAIETATVVMPPNMNSSCTSGRAFFSMGGWLQEASLGCLQNPGLCSSNCSSNPNSCVRQRRFSEPTIMNPASLPQTINTGVGSNQCTSASTAPMYVTAGGDTWLVRSGSNLVMFTAGLRRKTEFCNSPATCKDDCTNDPASACQPEWANGVNLSFVSSDCGNTWTPSLIIDNGDGNRNPAVPGTPCGNLDFFRAYVDPYKTAPSGHNYIYLMGFGGNACCGGVNFNALYRSGDGGRSFVKKAVLPGFTGLMGLTSFGDGSTVLFGCSEEHVGSPPHQAPRVLWSHGNDDTSFNTFEDPSLPACGMTLYYGNIFRFGPRGHSTISRMTSTTGTYNYFRFAYGHAPGAQNKVILGWGAIPRAGGTAEPHLREAGPITTIVPDTDIFHVSFIDPDPPSDTSLLYWEEINNLSKHNVRYSVVTGLRNYTTPRYLNLNASNPEPWVPTFPRDASGNMWGGEYDKGSAWYDPSSTSSMNVINYLAQWTQSHACPASTPTDPIHYNRVQVKEPKFTDTMPLALTTTPRSTDPGAAKLVTSGGVTQIHLFTADPNGAVQRAIYSENTNTWTGWSNVGSGGVTQRSATAVSWGPGRLDVFIIGTDNQMYHYPEQNGQQLLGGSGWEWLGAPPGGFIEGPGVTSVRSDHLFILGIGTGGAVYYKTWGPGWSDWQHLAGGFAYGAPAPFSFGPGRVEAFVRGTDNYLHQYIAWNDNTAGWEGRGAWFQLAHFGGAMTASPAAAVRDASRVDVVVGDGLYPYLTGPDGTGHSQIMHAWYDNGWSDFHSIGGILCGVGTNCAGSETGVAPHTSLAAVALSPNRVRVFYRALNKHIRVMAHNN
jgi:hypothetical protein